MPLRAIFFLPLTVLALDSCCPRTRREAIADPPLTDIRRLDRFYRQLLQKKILQSLNLDSIPVHAEQWWSRNREWNLTSPLDHEDHPSPSARFKLRVSAAPDADIKSRHRRRHEKKNVTNCEVTYHFQTELQSRKNHRVEVEQTELWLPLLMVEEAETLEMSRSRRGRPDSSSLRLADAVTRTHQGFRILDISQTLVAHPSRRLHLSVTANLPTSACLRQNHTQPAFLLLQLIQVPKKSAHSKRDADSRRRRQEEIIDCEEQWDQAHFNNTPFLVQEAILPCCRRRVVIDFQDISWNHWVVAPASFETYYCLGRCKAYGGFAVENNEGASFYAEIMNHKNTGRTLSLQPCCSPVKFSPLSITTLASDHEEMTQTIQDVIVDRCGCM